MFYDCSTILKSDTQRILPVNVIIRVLFSDIPTKSIVYSTFQNNCLKQQFSTWGTHTPGGTPKAHRGYPSSLLEVYNFKGNTKIAHFMSLK